MKPLDTYRKTQRIFVATFALSIGVHLVFLISPSLVIDGKTESKKKDSRVSILISPNKKNKAKAEIERPAVSPVKTPKPIPIEPLIDPQLLEKTYTVEDKETSTNTTEQSLDEVAYEYGMRQPAVKKMIGGPKKQAVEGIITSGTDGLLVSDGVVASETSPIISETDGLSTTDDSGEDSESADGVGSDLSFMTDSDELETFDIPNEFLGNFGNMTQLTELDLGNTFVEDPISENKGKEIRLVNGYLKRMSDQVREIWDFSLSQRTPYTGVIIIDLTSNGFLTGARLIQSTGIGVVDDKALFAVRAVEKYAVHINPEVNKKYFSRLAFSFSGGSIEYELMPFQKEIANKEDS